MPILLLLAASIALALLAWVCLAAFWYRRHHKSKPDAWRAHATGDTPDEWAASLVRQMTFKEKLAQLSGSDGFSVLIRLGINAMLLGRYPHVYAGVNRRLGLPPLSFTDGPRGVTVGRNTCLPVAMARGATWDTDLERRVGELLGREARANGANYFAGICVNLLRHPAWGRAQETFGEDPLHVGLMASATVRGVQRHGVMACVKHFALNSIEDSRFFVDVSASRRALHEVYLAPFRLAVEAGAASIMSAYNRVNGVPCGHHAMLLKETLRGRWGFRGFVSADWVWGMKDGCAALGAGVDLEMPRAVHYGRRLRRAARQGRADVSLIDASVTRQLTTRLAFARSSNAAAQGDANPPGPKPGKAPPDSYPQSLCACDEHRRLALEVAERSMALLKNDESCLPFGAVERLALIGPLASQANTGDRGSSLVSPPFTVSILEGMKKRLGPKLRFFGGTNPQKAAALACGADRVVIVAGLGPRDEGENLYSNHRPGKAMRRQRGGDRVSLALPGEQEALIRAVAAVNPRVVVVLIGGSAILTDTWQDCVSSILMAWYPGMLGGEAVARVLFGDGEPGGRLPFAWPSALSTLPPFDPLSPSVDYGLHHGMTWFDAGKQKPAWPFGHGLGYTRFAHGKAQILFEEDRFQVSVDVKNIGSRPGREVLQCYGGPHAPGTDDFRKRLMAFQPVDLAAGESRRVSLSFPAKRLARFDETLDDFRPAVDAFRFWIGPSSDEGSCQMLLWPDES